MSSLGDVDLAAAAALIGEPSRVALLQALTEEEALTARELAARAGIAPSTASEHLGKLVSGGLVFGRRNGRHRHFRLANPAVADAIEALAAIAPSRPVRSLRDATVGDALRRARTCYDHLAGRLGVELASALEREGILVHKDETYELGDSASAACEQLGIELAELSSGRRVLVRPCLDWSERRRHIAGAFGAALARRFFELGWLQRRSTNRSVEVTVAGTAGLRREFGLDLSY